MESKINFQELSHSSSVVLPNLASTLFSGDTLFESQQKDKTNSYSGFTESLLKETSVEQLAIKHSCKNHKRS